MKRITDVLNSAGKPWPEISPAFQWTQSSSHIYLNVKYAARWDTPSTLDCVTEVFNITGTHINYKAKCPATRKFFILNFPFFRDVDPENSNFTDAAVGRVTINVKKASEGNWNTLLKGKKPNNMHTWWAMEEQVGKENTQHQQQQQQKQQQQQQQDKANANNTVNTNTTEPVKEEPVKEEPTKEEPTKEEPPKQPEPTKKPAKKDPHVINLDGSSGSINITPDQMEEVSPEEFKKMVKDKKIPEPPHGNNEL